MLSTVYLNERMTQPLESQQKKILQLHFTYLVIIKKIPVAPISIRGNRYLKFGQYFAESMGFYKICFR